MEIAHDFFLNKEKIKNSLKPNYKTNNNHLSRKPKVSQTSDGIDDDT